MAKKTAKQTKTATRQPVKPGRDVKHIAADLRGLARSIDEASLDPANENVHDEGSIAAIAASLKKFGQRTPIVVNKKTGYIAKGNGTWLAARLNGWTKLAMVFVTDDAKTHTGYRLADNRTAQLAHFDDERLAQSLAILKDEDDGLFAALQLDALEASLPAGEDPPAVEVPEHYAVLIECKSEKEQKRLFDRLTREGLTCKLQIL